MKVASVATTSVVLPGIAWAFNMTRDMTDLRNRVEILAQQIDTDRRGLASICDEIKGLRTSVEALRSDVLQRLTRVETRLDSHQGK
jgi:uncharacterized protein YoxC